MSKPKLLFFGNERLATAVRTDAPTLRALVAGGYEVKAVISSHSEGVSRSKRGLEIVEVAHAYHIPVLLPHSLSAITDRISSFGAEAAVLVAFGKNIPQQIIDIFPKGIINVHPSLLPKLRGATPVETAISEGLPETGVSLMKLTAEMDAGPVYVQKKISLSGTETKPELAEKLLQEGSKLLIDNLDKILKGELKPMPQIESDAEYTKLLSRDDGLIDFQEPAEVIERKVRAFIGFPKTRAKIHGHEVVITKSRVAGNSGDGVLVLQCQPGWLEILELTAPSGRTISGSDFKRGYQKQE